MSKLIASPSGGRGRAGGAGEGGVTEVRGWCSMNSSSPPKSKTPPPLLVAEGGVAYRLSDSADPFSAWMDLMEAVEALCPEWPRREPSAGGIYRL
jgi:hypothetical protein